MKHTFRVIAKFGFILILMGFLMPLGCDMNGFEWADSSYASSGLSFGLYGLFITAIIGIIFGFIILIKKKLPVIIDWLILVTISFFVWIPFFSNVDNADSFQTGVYVILTGYAVATILQICSAVQKET